MKSPRRPAKKCADFKLDHYQLIGVDLAMQPDTTVMFVPWVEIGEDGKPFQLVNEDGEPLYRIPELGAG